MVTSGRSTTFPPGDQVAAVLHQLVQALPQLAEGSEHRVFVHADDKLVYKHTLVGTFGDTYHLVNGRVHQRRCLPSDYLARLELWDEVFGYAPASDCAQYTVRTRDTGSAFRDRGRASNPAVSSLRQVSFRW